MKNDVRYTLAFPVGHVTVTFESEDIHSYTTHQVYSIEKLLVLWKL